MIGKEDQIKNLRLIHIALLATSFALAVVLIERTSNEYAKAARQLQDVEFLTEGFKGTRLAARLYAHARTHGFVDDRIDSVIEFAATSPKEERKFQFVNFSIPIKVLKNELVSLPLLQWQLRQKTVDKYKLEDNEDNTLLYFANNRTSSISQIAHRWNALNREVLLYRIEKLSGTVLYRSWPANTPRFKRPDWLPMKYRRLEAGVPKTRAKPTLQSFSLNVVEAATFRKIINSNEAIIKKSLAKGHFSAGKSDYIAVLELDYQRLWLNSRKDPARSNTLIHQAYIPVHLRFATKLNLLSVALGSEKSNLAKPFDEAFPELHNTTRAFDSSDLEKVKGALEILAAQPNQRVELFGTKLGTENIVLVLAVILVAMQSYFALHLAGCARVNKNSDAAGSLLPWIGIYEDKLSEAALLLSAFAIPTLVMIATLFFKGLSSDSLFLVQFGLAFLSFSLTVFGSWSWVLYRRSLGLDVWLPIDKMMSFVKKRLELNIRT
ncbi:MAG: hypothetical protein JXQ99_16260 [Hyphomicrobiaceae bacterium]